MIFSRRSGHILTQRFGVLVDFLGSTLLQRKFARRVFLTAQTLISGSESEVNRRILRRKLHGGFKRLHRVLRLAGIEQGTAQAEMGFRKRWIKLGGPREMLDGFGQLVLLPRKFPQIIFSARVPRKDFQLGFEFLARFFGAGWRWAAAT